MKNVEVYTGPMSELQESMEIYGRGVKLMQQGDDSGADLIVEVTNSLSDKHIHVEDLEKSNDFGGVAEEGMFIRDGFLYSFCVD